jgi:uncharacterized protein
MSATAARASIDAFLGQRRFVMAGVSRNPRDFSRMLFREFLRRGYDVVPLHPAAEEIEGRACVRLIAAVEPPVEGVLFMTPPAATADLIHDCGAAGVKRVWMYRAAGVGAVSRTAVEYCAAHGIDVVPGECPMMFLPGAGWMHLMHGLLRRIAPSYFQIDAANLRY